VKNRFTSGMISQDGLHKEGIIPLTQNVYKGLPRTGRYSTVIIIFASMLLLVIFNMYISEVLGLILFSSLSFAHTDSSDHSNRCVNPRVRKSWFVFWPIQLNLAYNFRHYMTDDAKLEYIRAVKCLWTLPAKGTAEFPASQNRHEDFSSLHINQTTGPDRTNNPASKRTCVFV
jgi:hypothetical protein